MKIGYIRVSTEGQNTGRQEVLMSELGVDEIYIDKCSGKNKDRPQLKVMMNYIRKGDILIVESISRFARNTRDLLALVDQLNDKGVTFISKKEAMDTNTPSGKFMLTVMGAMAEMEREYILDRQREGIALAKAQGKYKGRKPIEVNGKVFNEYYPSWKHGQLKAVEFMRKLNVKKTTFYKIIQEYEQQQQQLSKEA
jgi:DNA invertase Pin-like site-specific DNA recombinase